MWSYKVDTLYDFTNFCLLDRSIDLPLPSNDDEKKSVRVVVKGSLVRSGWDKFFNSQNDKGEKLLDLIKTGSSSIKQYSRDRVIFPPMRLVYRIFELVPPEKIRVVIIGQDPYFHFGEATGVAFSVNPGVKIPSSLRNIFKEIIDEYPKKKIPENGDLTRWVDQGVFLINTALTVSDGKAGSHLKEWKEFTERLMKYLNSLPQNLIVIAWGNPAQTHLKHFDVRHERLMSAHPSGLSASRGFYGNGHFLKVNKLLKRQGQEEIDW